MYNFSDREDKQSIVRANTKYRRAGCPRNQPGDEKTTWNTQDSNQLAVILICATYNNEMSMHRFDLAYARYTFRLDRLAVTKLGRVADRAMSCEDSALTTCWGGG